jgi:hypothetical protein
VGEPGRPRRQGELEEEGRARLFDRSSCFLRAFITQSGPVGLLPRRPSEVRTTGDPAVRANRSLTPFCPDRADAILDPSSRFFLRVPRLTSLPSLTRVQTIYGLADPADGEYV